MVKAMPQAAIDSARGRTPVDRLGLPSEIARVVRFLIDDNSGYITGATYDVNGDLHVMIGAVPLEEFATVSIFPVPIRHRLTIRCAQSRSK